MRRHLLPLLCGGLLALASAAPAGAATPRVVGGGATTIAKHPYQVAVVTPGFAPYVGFFCGGVILDAVHVATAAHCVLQESSAQALAPADVAVVAGTATLSTSPDPAHTHAVAVTSFDPAFDPATEAGDVAVLRLASPLWSGSAPQLNGSTTIAPIPIAAAAPAAAATVTVSGWGYDQPLGAADSPVISGYPAGLRAADVTVVGQPACQAQWSGTTITGAMLCTSATTAGAACFGDSGGPIVTGATAPGAPAGERLAGLVNFGGTGCAQGTPPDVAAAVSDPALKAFVTGGPPQAPLQSAAAVLAGSAQAGRTVTCRPGAWSGNPGFAYRFGVVQGASAVPITGFGPSAALRLTTAQVGEQILCEVRAVNAGGYGSGDSAPVTVAAASATPPSTGAGPTIGSARDVRRPTATIAARRCTRHRCVVNVRVTDPRPSAGIRGLRAVLSRTLVTRCGRPQHRHRCTRHRRRRLHPRATGAGHFLVIARGLGHHTYTLALRAVDKAGHVERALVTVRLRPPRR